MNKPCLRWTCCCYAVFLCLLAGLNCQSVLAEEQSDKPDNSAEVENSENESIKPDKPGKGVKKVNIKNPFPKRFPAPELDGGIEWLNTSGEISLKDLRGKVVLLDFWTFCCINCMHVLPDLEYLEQKFDKELVVIGVHSAKFDNERETGNIRKAILRYEISHPVINDARMTVWRKFNVNSWPTMVLIDPEGFYCGSLPGEGNREVLEKVIANVIEYHKSKGTLDETPVHFHLERSQQPATPLKFPGKLLADVDGKRLFISDSNHNRIVIASLEGKLLDVIGTGQIGAKDGNYRTAEFDHPQGMCLVQDTLYVADTENHLLRKIDLNKKTVETFAGTGKQAHFRAKGGELLNTALNSPWDLCEVHGVLYIAMAGPHQIWSHKLGSEVIQPYAGSGREDITNGTLDQSALAQPSGIVTDGSNLYVVDSEGSSVRVITTSPKQKLSDPSGAVKTIVGTSDLPQGRALFEFGDVDGVGDDARLQHPLGIVYYKGRLMVADSYNHKLKMIDPKSQRCETWLGTGKPGQELHPVQLAEPAGLAVAENTLFVADTNNHRILAVDIQTKETKEFQIEGLTAPDPTLAESLSTEVLGNEALTEIPEQSVRSREQLTLKFDFKLPEGYKLNELAPLKCVVGDQGQATLIAPESLKQRLPVQIRDGQAIVQIPLAEMSGKAVLSISLSYGYCRNGTGGLCKLSTQAWKVPVDVSPAGKSEAIQLTAAPK